MHLSLTSFDGLGFVFAAKGRQSLAAFARNRTRSSWWKMNKLFDAVQATAGTWHEAKLAIERTVELSQDSLHVIASVLVQLFAAHLLQKPLSSWWPWFVVLVAASSNEAVDLWIEQWPEPAVQYGEGAWDMVLTMALPSVLLFTIRNCPALYRPAGSSRAPKL